MFAARQPSKADIEGFISHSRGLPLSYSPIGIATAAQSRRGRVDELFVTIGQGTADFERARKAVAGWEHFDMPWVPSSSATAIARARHRCRRAHSPLRLLVAEWRSRGVHRRRNRSAATIRIRLRNPDESRRERRRTVRGFDRSADRRRRVPPPCCFVATECSGSDRLPAGPSASGSLPSRFRGGHATRRGRRMNPKQLDPLVGGRERQREGRYSD